MEKIWTLAYEDDMMVIAEDERGMKRMIKCTEKYIKKKKFEINTDKTKIFKKAGGREKTGAWR